MTTLHRATLLALALVALGAGCALWRAWRRAVGAEAVLIEECRAAIMAEVSRVFAEATVAVEREVGQA